MIAALILFSIAATNLIWSIIITAVTKSEEWLFCFILSAAISILGVGFIFDSPTNSNVRKGNAHYVEQTHIEVLNGDTINTYKTYSLEWKKAK